MSSCCCPVAESCLTLHNPVDCSTPGFPVLYHLPEFAQTHVHRAGDAIQPSRPLLSPSPPAFNLPQHQSLFQCVSSSHQVAKVLEFQLQHQSFCQMGRIGKRSPKWRWLQDKEGKSPRKGNEDLRTGVRTSGKTNNTPGWPNLHRTGPGREKHINRGARANSLSLSPMLGRSSPRVFGLTCPHALKMDFPAIF